MVKIDEELEKQEGQEEPSVVHEDDLVEEGALLEEEPSVVHEDDLLEEEAKKRGFLYKLNTFTSVWLSVASLVLIIGRLFFFTPYDVSGQSMYPTLHDGDRIVVSHDKELERGDVVVFTSPITMEDDYIKRVVGVAGDTVEIRSGHVYVNGKQLEDENLGTTQTLRTEDTIKTLVPTGTVYVLGDNRENSMDSRVFGAVPDELIKGKLLLNIGSLK